MIFFTLGKNPDDRLLNCLPVVSDFADHCRVKSQTVVADFTSIDKKF